MLKILNKITISHPDGLDVKIPEWQNSSLKISLFEWMVDFLRYVFKIKKKIYTFSFCQDPLERQIKTSGGEVAAVERFQTCCLTEDSLSPCCHDFVLCRCDLERQHNRCFSQPSGISFWCFGCLTPLLSVLLFLDVGTFLQRLLNSYFFCICACYLQEKDTETQHSHTQTPVNRYHCMQFLSSWCRIIWLCFQLPLCYLSISHSFSLRLKRKSKKRQEHLFF